MNKKATWIAIIGITALLTTSGCKKEAGKEGGGKKGGGLLSGIIGGVDSTMSEVGVDFMKNISSSVLTGVRADQINGIQISSMTTTIPVTVELQTKILEKYDQPFIKVDQLDIMRKENFPAGTRITKKKTTYERGRKRIVQEELYEPVEKKPASNNDIVILITIIAIQIISLFASIKAIRKLNKISKEGH